MDGVDRRLAVAARGARLGLPLALGRAASSRRLSAGQRLAAAAALGALWTVTYSRYRSRSLELTRHDWELMATATPEAYSRHYNEHVPTVEEEMDLWGDYHGHRHEMRYRLVADSVRAQLTGQADNAKVLDIGCGAALVADRLLDLPISYVGLEYGEHHVDFAATKHRAGGSRLTARFVRGDATRLPFDDGSFDIVVMSEVIEHLMQPELAVWEVARVLRPGGSFVMTTNNASEMPLRAPFSDPFAFLEKAVGFHHDRLISHRPWVWPWPIDRSLLAPEAPDVWVPHTWHKQSETRRMFAAAGLTTIQASTFEFPPPQSKSAAWLERGGRAGRLAVDVIESVCQATPLVNRLGCHLFMVARRDLTRSQSPPPGIWPGPFSASIPATA